MGSVVETATGRVEGTSVGAVQAYLGIPYAAPPVGALRFSAPQPAQSWTGVRDCTNFGPIPLQHDAGPVEPTVGMRGAPQSEDCLTVNVWTPAADGGRRPVMVWIYGGGFINGCGSSEWMSGHNLAARDAVIVTFNYRVGAFGFTALANLFGDDFAAAGNAGFLDQVLALRWVQDNIAAFGGDPGKVTIFGQSAGGVSVGLHIASPLSAGTFRATIVQSSGAHTVHRPDEAATVAELLARELEIRPPDARRLREVPTEQILAAQGTVMGEVLGRQAAAPMSARYTMVFQPVSDGSSVPHDVLGAVAASDPTIPLMIGTTEDELGLVGPLVYPESMTPDDAARKASEIFGSKGAGEAALALYSAGGARTAQQTFIALDADRCVRIPAVRLAEHHPGTVSFYRFTLTGTGLGGPAGSAHAYDIPFTFDTLDGRGVADLIGKPDDAARQLAKSTADAWIHFAATGEASTPAGPWPEYEPHRRQTAILGVEPAIVDDPDGAQRAVWDGIY